ncbi:MAG TPA: sugar ABC transporter permease [Euzebyales bacterium]|nr:sugar ABC transporter permease [Euzebyales bacterium]
MDAKRRETLSGWAFSAPSLALLTIFLIVPFALAIGLSFTNQRLISPLPTRFVGVANYLAVFGDRVFWRAVINNVVFAAIVVPVQTALALWLAVLVDRPLRGMKVYRTIYFMPVVSVMAVAATVWKLLYEPDTGAVNSLLGLVTGGALQPEWLRSTTWALPAIVIMSIWQGVGFQMIVILAGLQGIPQVLYEAGDVDGAGRWQRFRFITLPQLRNTLIFVVTVTAILAFRLFDQVYVMTSGGPRNATQTMLLQMVEVGFGQQRIAQGSAIAVVFFVIVLSITLVQRRLLREEREIT